MLTPEEVITYETKRAPIAARESAQKELDYHAGLAAENRVRSRLLKDPKIRDLHDAIATQHEKAVEHYGDAIEHFAKGRDDHAHAARAKARSAHEVAQKHHRSIARIEAARKKAMK